MTIWRSTLAQTAVTVAAQRVAVDNDLDFDEVRDEVMEYLEGFASADDDRFEKSSGTGSSRSSSTSRSKKTGGSSKRSSGGGSRRGGKVTLDDALDMELNFGAFEGVTLGELLDIDVDKAESKYEYGDGERDGRDYLSWLASDRNKNEFARTRAQLVADDAGIDYEA